MQQNDARTIAILAEAMAQMALTLRHLGEASRRDGAPFLHDVEVKTREQIGQLQLEVDAILGDSGD